MAKKQIILCASIFLFVFGTWFLGICQPQSPDTPASYGSTNSGFEETWRFGYPGDYVGKSGIIAADIDSDGIVEILFGGSTRSWANNFWFILEFSEESQEYFVEWYSSVYPLEISTIAAFDVHQKGIFTIFIGLENGTILMVDGATLEETGRINTPAGSINRILMADVDSDTIDEIIICDYYNVFVYDAHSHFIKAWVRHGGLDMEIGDVDGDDGLEIVLSSGFVIDCNGEDPVIEWEYAGHNGFGQSIELSDVDSDNMDEIIGVSAGQYVTAYDVDLHSPKWQIDVDSSIDSLFVADVDGDGIEDLLVIEGRWIVCYDLASHEEKFHILTNCWITNIAVSDTDGDEDLELIFGEDGAFQILIYDIATLSQEWQMESSREGPFYAVDVGDVDADDEKEIVIVSLRSNNGSSAGILYIFDGLTHSLEFQSSADMFDYADIYDVKIGDVDDDGQEEIVVAGDGFGFDAVLYIINGGTYEVENTFTFDDIYAFSAITLADVDMDGETEIIAGTMRHPASVYVINSTTGEIEWESLYFFNNIYDLDVGDVTGDGLPDIVAVGSSVFVIDLFFDTIWQSYSDGHYCLDLYDMNNDSIDEIIIGNDYGAIFSMDGRDYFLEETEIIPGGFNKISGLRVHDIDGNGYPEIIFAGDEVLGVYSIEEAMLWWETIVPGDSAGMYNSLSVNDIDGDGSTEIILGTDRSVVEFTCPSTFPLFEEIYFPRLSYIADVATEGFGFVNTGSSDVRVNFSQYNETGQMENRSYIIRFPAHSQNAIQAEYIFRLSENTNGWVRAKSNSPGLLGFFLSQRYDNGLVAMDGAVVTGDTVRNGIIPRVKTSDGASTELYLANPGQNPVDVQIVGFDGVDVWNGGIHTIAGHGFLRTTMSDLFGEKRVFDGYLRLQATGGIVGNAVITTDDSTISSVAIQPVEEASEILYAAHISAVENLWFTEVNLINTTNENADVILTLFNADGAPIDAVVEVVVPARQILTLRDTELGLPARDMGDAWLKIESAHHPLLGCLTFGDPVGNRYESTMPLQATGAHDIYFAQVANGNDYGYDFFTGISIVNPFDTAVDVDIRIHFSNGGLNGQVIRTLQPGEKYVRLLQEIEGIGPLLFQSSGFIHIKATGPVLAFELFGDNTLNFVSAVPAQFISDQ